MKSFIPQNSLVNFTFHRSLLAKISRCDGTTFECAAQEDGALTMLLRLRQKRAKRENGARSIAGRPTNRQGLLDIITAAWVGLPQFFPKKNPTETPIKDAKLQDLIVHLAKLLAAYLNAGVISIHNLESTSSTELNSPIVLLTSSGIYFQILLSKLLF